MGLHGGRRRRGEGALPLVGASALPSLPQLTDDWRNLWAAQAAGAEAEPSQRRHAGRLLKQM